MTKGFTLYLLKAVISGHGEEAVNLAKTYLGRQGGLAMTAHGSLMRMPESRRVNPATRP
jgi:hypothetical protein